MKNTADFLDDLKAKLDLPSDGRLAAYLGIHRQYLSRYRNNVITFDDETSMKIADLLNIEQAYVVACMHAQRAKRSEERALWGRIAERMYVAAAAVLVVLALPYLGADTSLDSIGLVGSIALNGDLHSIHYA